MSQKNEVLSSLWPTFGDRVRGVIEYRTIVFTVSLSVRKFFCDVPACPRKIFAERLAPFAAPWARVTARLFQMVQIIGLATGGRLGVRVTDRMGIQTRRHTILRRIMALPTKPVEQVTHIGIDDFSFRRGRKFGTIVVDLQTHQVLDLLDVKRDYLMVY